jgi:hypothetical protein
MPTKSSARNGRTASLCRAETMTQTRRLRRLGRQHCTGLIGSSYPMDKKSNGMLGVDAKRLAAVKVPSPTIVANASDRMGSGWCPGAIRTARRVRRPIAPAEIRRLTAHAPFSGRISEAERSKSSARACRQHLHGGSSDLASDGRLVNRACRPDVPPAAVCGTRAAHTRPAGEARQQGAAGFRRSRI